MRLVQRIRDGQIKQQRIFDGGDGKYAPVNGFWEVLDVTKFPEDMQIKMDKYCKDQYQIPAPPVPTNQWLPMDWINYIDSKGQWL